MALTGLGVLGFIVGHLAGNLQVFLGAEVFNSYAAFLKGLGAGLWVARIGLIVIFVLHVVTAIRLSRENSVARPERYRANSTVQATLASRYMLHSGMLILIFLIVHLLHFTLGVLEPQHFHYVDAQGNHDVFKMLVLGFKNTTYSTLYIVCMIALGFHISHAISSAAQTLGINHEKYTPIIHNTSAAIGFFIAVGYISIPVAVLMGWVGIGGL